MRVSLVTGRMPHKAGVEYNDICPVKAGTPNMGDVFRPAGHETARAGKWHLPQAYPQGVRATVPGFGDLQVGEGIRSGLSAQTDGAETLRRLLTRWVARTCDDFTYLQDAAG